MAVDGTNGIDLNEPSNPLKKRATISSSPVAKFRQQPAVTAPLSRKHALNVMLETTPLQDISLPPGLTPTSNINGSSGVSQFFLLDDGKTGVLALGSFSENSFDGFETTLITGLTNLKNAGATQLIVDVVCGAGPTT